MAEFRNIYISNILFIRAQKQFSACDDCVSRSSHHGCKLYTGTWEIVISGATLSMGCQIVPESEDWRGFANLVV